MFEGAEEDKMATNNLKLEFAKTARERARTKSNGNERCIMFLNLKRVLREYFVYDQEEEFRESGLLDKLRNCLKS